MKPRIALAWKGRSPTVSQRIRETIGRALRESGQALDRAGQELESFTWLPDKYVGCDPPKKYQDFLSRHRQQMPMLHCGRPVVSPQAAFIAPCATLIGSVCVQEGASIWYGAILRGDTCLNAGSFDQTDDEILREGQQLMLKGGDTDEDGGVGTVVETEEDDKPLYELGDKNLYADGGGIFVGVDTNIQDGVIVTARSSSTILGQGVTVGHLAQLHSTTVDDFALIGMGSILQEGSHVETEAFVAAGAVVPPNTIVGAGELWVGQPARKVRDLSTEERQRLHYQSSEYVKVALTHPMELGENIQMPWQDALLEQIENEPNVHDQVARMNKWNNTVYGYLTRPKPKLEELGSGKGEQDDQQQGVEGGDTADQQQKTIIPKEEAEKERQVLEAAPAVDTEKEVEEQKQQQQQQPQVEIVQQQVDHQSKR